MVKLTSEELHNIMDLKENIRSLTIIAHVDHGKSTLATCLTDVAGVFAQDVAGNDKITNTRKRNGITIKPAGSSLYCEVGNKKYLVNLMDSPSHFDVSAEVTCALRFTDGALVIIDSIEGVCAQTKTVQHQALRERVKPVLTVNKMDRCFLELGIDGEEAYQKIQRAIEDANIIISTCGDPLLGDTQVYPERGTVAFTSGLHGWGFTILKFAKLYAKKFRVSESMMMERLWGENYFDSCKKTWTYKNTGSPTCKRGFVQFCYEPVQQVINTCLSNQKEKLWPMLRCLGVSLKGEETELLGKALMKRVMQTWLPVSTALLEMIIFHLPCPSTAQKYRAENLYAGPNDDIYATAIKNCDPEGPLMLYVSALVQSSDKGRFFAHGRVFSGKIETGKKVRIMGPSYIVGQSKDLYTTCVKRTAMWMGKNQQWVNDVPCGNMVTILGVDQYITKYATLTNANAVDAHPIRAMKFSVSPVVHIVVQCKVTSDLPKLIEGLKRLSKSDPSVKCAIEESGEHIISGAGELHLLACLNDLVNDLEGTEIVYSPPVVSFCETVTGKSCRTVMGRSTIIHKLSMEARPLENGLVEAIANGLFGPKDGQNKCSTFLSKEFGWDKDVAKSILCFGPESSGPNMVVANCEGDLKSEEDVKESIVAAFNSVSQKGALCEENMRGVCFELQKVDLQVNAGRRGYGQIVSAAKRVMYESQLSAKPRLQEPVYLVEIQASEQALGNIYGVLNQRRGHVWERIQRPNTQLYNIRAFLPVRESFGFEQQLRSATSSLAFSQCVFDHWDTISCDPFEAGSEAAKLVGDIRKRKGLKELVNPLPELENKL